MIKAAGHGQTNFTDKEAVALVEHILSSHRRVMPKLYAIDKWPNIDGYLELQDADFNLFGKFEVQVKALPKNHKNKYKSEVPFLAYCRDVAQIPVLLFGVDREQERVYWLHIDTSYVQGLDLKPSQKTKTISFDSDKWFNKDRYDYIDEWMLITRAAQARIRSYDEMLHLYRDLLEASNIAVGKQEPYYASIHSFLDQINYLLDGELNIVKRRLYPGSWKIGLAYYTYTNYSISYSLYPIPFDYNDVQIKQVDKLLGDKLRREGTDFYWISTDNPLHHNPEEYARNILHSNVMRLLRDRLLEHTCSDFLANEYVYAYLRKCAKLNGLELRDEYTLIDIEQLLSSGSFIEPPKYSSSEINYPFFIFYELLSYLKGKGINSVHQIYKRPMETIDDVKYNLEVLFDNFEQVYESIVIHNFYRLQSNLSIFNKSTTTLVTYYLEDENNIYKGPPQYWLYILISKDENQEKHLIVKRRDIFRDDIILLKNEELLYEDSLPYRKSVLIRQRGSASDELACWARWVVPASHLELGAHP